MTKSLWHTNVSSTEIKEHEYEKPDGGIQLRSLYSLISTGTERSVLLGQIPLELKDHMSVPYMEGSFNLPIKYGYSLVAETSNKEVFHLLHPHQKDIAVPQEKLHKVPKNIPALRASLASNMETAINAIWDGKLSGKEKVLICGFGNIGCLLAESIFQLFGIRPFILEKNEYRKEFAKTSGFGLYDGTTSFDVVYNTTANEQVLQEVIQLCKRDGKIVELSWYGNKKITLSLGNHFHYNRIKIISSQVSNIPAHKAENWDYEKRKDLVFDLLKAEAYDKYITAVVPFESAPDFFDLLRNDCLPEGLIWAIKY